MTKNSDGTSMIIELETAYEDIQRTNADWRGAAMTLEGKNPVIDQRDGDRLDAADVKFAYLCDYEMPDGRHRIATVPVN